VQKGGGGDSNAFLVDNAVSKCPIQDAIQQAQTLLPSPLYCYSSYLCTFTPPLVRILGSTTIPNCNPGRGWAHSKKGLGDHHFPKFASVAAQFEAATAKFVAVLAELLDLSAIFVAVY